ncbi:hypothetical protein [Pseudorhodoplanes sp.]|uniref:hypothetical protein n=1 Tax=Pseudorhodoplanes sp. TaxID=1934341 RepID=UPI002BBCE05F|nr:hypothetical protein [Pseudorhodoplanes sp.]HWV44158.1 hypothetical protein [Pseudorhodoplanes sp.]
MRQFTVTRDVTPQECGWLSGTVRKGERVFEFTGHTYGCVGAGIPVSYKVGETPFFEMPRDALKSDKPK